MCVGIPESATTMGLNNNSNITIMEDIHEFAFIKP